MQAGDAIDIAYQAANGLTFSSGTLDVTENGSLIAAIALSGSYTTASFTLGGSDGAGGTLIRTNAHSPAIAPSLTLPPAETVSAGGSIDVAGISFADSFASTNPGAMYLRISDTTGTLYASGGSGAAISGSGSTSLTLNGSYAQVNLALASLRYTAGGHARSDTIRFDLWDQAGVETTGSLGVTINAGSGGGGTTETWTGAVSSDWNTPANWSGNRVPTSGDTADIPGGTPNNGTLSNATLSNETIVLIQPAAPTPDPTVDFDGVTLGSGTVLEAANPTHAALGAIVDVAGGLTIDAGATVAPEAGAALAIMTTDAADVITNHGTIENTIVSFFGGGTGTLTNAGLFEANGSSASIEGNAVVLNAGSIVATNNGAIGVNPGVAIRGGTVLLANGDMSMGGSFVGTAITLTGSSDLLLLSSPMAFTGGAAITGFGQGDQIDLTGSATATGATIGFANGTLEVALGGSVIEAISFAGIYGIGNFEVNSGFGVPGVIAYAPNDGVSGLVNPDIAAPASAGVAQGGTLALDDVSIHNTATATLVSITANTGTLYMNAAIGSGTHQVTVSGSTTQVDADLASLRYVAAAGTSADMIEVAATVSATNTYNETDRWIPVSISSGGAELTEPSGETVAPGGTVAVSGSYSDSFAQGNPGSSFLGISDSSGTLTATNASGSAVAGSGTHAIALSADYVDVNAILASLHYTAGANAGSDTISFQVWNQAGHETTGSTGVTIDAPALGAASHTASANLLADFIAPGSGATAPMDTGRGSGGSVGLSDLPEQTSGMPFASH